MLFRNGNMQVRLFVIASVMGAGMLWGGCIETVPEPVAEVVRYALAVTVDGQGSVDPAGGEHDPGTAMVLTADPAEGWHFVRWEGGAAGTYPTVQLTMDRDKTITAVLEQDPPVTLTVAATGQGVVAPDVGAHVYANGQEVTLTASAAEGWHFVRWEGGANGTDPTVAVTMDGDKTVTAVFEEDAPQYTLTVAAEGEGTVDPAVGDHVYDDGTVVTLTATAAAGWRFARWEGDVAGEDNPIDVTMAANRTVTAVFVRQYTLTVAVSGQGTVDPAVGDHVYDAGTVVTVTATAAAQWLFTRWAGDASGHDGTTTITLDGDKEITAVFEQNPQVRLVTTKGDILLELNYVAAPVTTANFLRYVNEGYFDGTDDLGATIFHRVISEFMIQGGGFTVDLTHKATHEPIVNEASNGLPNDRGTIAMARTSDPNSATAEFFINVVDNDFLNFVEGQTDGYAVFGRVLEGMEVADAIVAVDTHSVDGQDDVPIEPITITSVSLVEQP